ncbi:hypothetical protein ZIOFF_023824 [Zingiber officinale]|uniref:Small nuclear ribonucleoprotein E n=1 Tax=Zingiber officinale TaxID=94328 RepID=A0A8J5H1F8_ZINOF|nr:hypothetical protein ZIOFF_023824 [Zingiber officinale]
MRSSNGVDEGPADHDTTHRMLFLHLFFPTLLFFLSLHILLTVFCGVFRLNPELAWDFLPQNLIFRFLQSKARIQIWLFEQKDLRIEGRIIGFDEYMNLVLEEAEEFNVKKNTRKSLGRILLKGDNITLMMNTQKLPWSQSFCAFSPAILYSDKESVAHPFSLQPAPVESLMMGKKESSSSATAKAKA